MIKKYVTTPLVVDVIKFDGSHDMVKSIIEYFRGSARLEEGYEYGRSRMMLRLYNRDGSITKIHEGDFIVKGALGEIFVYRDNLFNAMFVEVKNG